MHVFVIGATGLIGRAVTRDLLAAGHKVTGLARNDTAQAALDRLGAKTCAGDMRTPGKWAAQAVAADVILQAGATFQADMGQVDAGVLATLHQASGPGGMRLIYTGGVWLYGDTGGREVDETAPFNPIAPYAWMIRNARWLEKAGGTRLAVLHPGLVYDSSGAGVLSGFLDAARSGLPPTVLGDPGIRWPLVHADDLARAYRLLVEHPELEGHFNAVAQSGVPVGGIAQTISTTCGSGQAPVVRPRGAALKELGDTALGPLLDQRVSAAKLDKAGWRPAGPFFPQVLERLSSRGSATHPA